ncbi:MAG: LysR substrate-binding domain-containing protein, partial [Alphaproteobacteria bacterium]
MIPSLKCLLAFEAVARNRSVSRAAAELGVTQPAISQRLRQLEEVLGRSLLRRTARGIGVDEAGELYAARLRRALDEIAEATAAIRPDAAQAAEDLTLSLLSTLAQRWLIPRLSRFQDAHPDMAIRLLTPSRPADLARDDVDLSIRCGSGRWPGFHSDLLMRNLIGVVASPALMERRPVRAPHDLADHVLIQIDAPPRDRDWVEWLAAAGAPDLVPRRRLSFSTSTQALEAAVAGLGVAISHTPFIVDALDAGTLVRPLDLMVPDREGDYFLLTPRHAQARKVRAFRRWLLAEVG